VTVPRPVVSADDVRAAHRRGQHRLVIGSGSIVTPLARDEAARWGIELVVEGVGRHTGERPPGEASKSRHAATCDPDDLERIVERVRQQVPEADAAVVREIAERVLGRLAR
jgi:hypothetical protein